MVFDFIFGKVQFSLQAQIPEKLVVGLVAYPPFKQFIGGGVEAVAVSESVHHVLNAFLDSTFNARITQPVALFRFSGGHRAKHAADATKGVAILNPTCFFAACIYHIIR
jgi:hypothetical protein